jgi:hypothetical protein
LLDVVQQKESSALHKERIENAYFSVVDAMPGLQVRAAGNLDFSMCYPRPEFEFQSMHWDLNYFKYCFLKPMKISFDEQELEDDFTRLIRFLLEARREFFMFRDFQSRNIMLRGNDWYFIDFQGGRRGPLQYDLASLLFEAKTNLSADFRLKLLDYYLALYEKEFSFFDRVEFLKYFYGFVYIRLMQAMGAYGFRGFIERKPLFLQSVPAAVKTLEWLLSCGKLPIELPCLYKVFETIIRSPEIKEFDLVHESLTISINSFSYKAGIPADNTGHGGGFVFDCRAIVNPGRYEEFRNLTGKDREVVHFLDNAGDMIDFLDHAFALVEKSIEVYKHRGHTSLMVNFGCTGGQHRSVYAAEKLCAYIGNKYPVKVVLRHREIEKAGKT